MNQILAAYRGITCPQCKGQLAESPSGSIMCLKCGSIDSLLLLSNVLNLSPQLTQQVLQSGKFGPVEPREDRRLVATNLGIVVNSLSEGGPQYDFPTLFPTILENKEVVIVNSIKLYMRDDCPPNVMLYTGRWQTNWSLQLKGRIICVLYEQDEREAGVVARSLIQAKAFVKVGLYFQTWDKSIQDAEFVATQISKQSLEEVKSLSELIDRYHYRTGKDGVRHYYPSLNKPVRFLAEDVMQWFTNNGAKFLWDDSMDVGYLHYDGRVFCLEASNKSLRSLLQKLGGISYSTSEGRAILDRLLHSSEEAEHISPAPWIQLDRGNKIVSINQGKETILLSSNKVEIEKSDRLTYDLIRGEAKWFLPIKLTASVGNLQLVKDYIMNYIVLPPTGTEIVISWLTACFLQEFSAIRPGIRLWGKASSGKSTILELLFRFFYGKEEKLPAFSTVAGLWRIGNLEPFLPLDNKNVEGLEDGFRTFFDIAATGGQRILGTSGSGLDVRVQKAHSLVMISGLDVFLDHDVRTRYIEMEALSEWKTEFYAVDAFQKLTENRNEIFTAIFHMIANDVLPNIEKYMNLREIKRWRILLGSKERIVDYFLIMLAIGEAFQKHGVFEEGNIGERWCEYINVNATKTDIINSKTIEWFTNFQYAINTYGEDWTKMNIEGISIEHPFNLVKKGTEVIGICDSIEVLCNVLAWTAKVLNRRSPWNSSRELMNSLQDEEAAWTAKGWSQVIDKEKGVCELRWN